MSLPNAIIAGINKAGTTSLYRYLGDHPEVCLSSRKETQFFINNTRDNDGNLALEEYESYFSHCAVDTKIRLEASPRYLYAGADVAQLIKTYLPDVRIIIALRNPIDRLESYFFSRKHRQDKYLSDISTIDDFVSLALNIDRGGAVNLDSSKRRVIGEQIHKGRYVKYLDEYLSCIGKERIHIVFFDDIVSETQKVLCRLSRYLDIDPTFYDEYVFSIENRTRQYWFPLVHNLTFKANVKLEPILNLFPWIRKKIRNVYDVLFEVKKEREKLAPEVEEMLMEYYRPWNNELAVLLRKEYPEIVLPSWLM